jgi:enediyne biosynthesis protein E5
LVALLAAYSTTIILDLVDCTIKRVAPALLRGSLQNRIDFLLPAHISGIAVAMLTYANDNLSVVAFASTVAIASKSLFRAPMEGRIGHFFNPSNFGISAALLLFPWVGVAMPYQFTENLLGFGDWLLPLLIICTGSLLNIKLTGRTPLILAWVGGFTLQATIRSWIFETPLLAGLLPMTGVAFILFTFYMITDPQTTPEDATAQVWFGLGVAAVYGTLMVLHIVFGLFFALSIVCFSRGLWLWSTYLAKQTPFAKSPIFLGETTEAVK